MGDIRCSLMYGSNQFVLLLISALLGNGPTMKEGRSIGTLVSLVEKERRRMSIMIRFHCELSSAIMVLL